MSELKGRLALVTGASYGIGAELARSFAAGGYNLVVVARSIDRLEQLAQALSIEYDRQVYVEACDLSDSTARKDLLARLNAQNLHPDVLINNAGIGSNGSFWNLDPEREMAQVHLNIAALVDLSRHFLPHMVAKDSGGVLNIASTAGFQAGPYMATYFASKSFVISFSEALNHELLGTNVHVTVHCPGPTESNFAVSAGNDESLLFKMNVAKAEVVAQDAYNAFHKGKGIAVQGWINSILVWGGALSPRWLKRRLAARLNQK